MLIGFTASLFEFRGGFCRIPGLRPAISWHPRRGSRPVSNQFRYRNQIRIGYYEDSAGNPGMKPWIRRGLPQGRPESPTGMESKGSPGYFPHPFPGFYSGPECPVLFCFWSSVILAGIGFLIYLWVPAWAI